MSSALSQVVQQPYHGMGFTRVLIRRSEAYCGYAGSPSAQWPVTYSTQPIQSRRRRLAQRDYEVAIALLSTPDTFDFHDGASTPHAA